MGGLIGFVVGYVLGARAGQEGLDELKEAWQSVIESEEFRGMVSIGKMMAQNALAQAGGSLAQNLKDLGDGKGPLGDALRSLSGNEDVVRVLSRLGESDEMRRLMANGSQLLGGAIAQVMAATQARRPNGDARAA